jgi:WD40 repeat protein
MPARLDDHEYDHYPPTVYSVRFSPDGRTLANATSRDPAVRLRDPATGRVHLSLRGPADEVTSVEFAPDGATLVVGDGRGSLTLWDLESGCPRATWKVQNNSIKSIAFAGDGRTLATAGEGFVKLWEMSDKGER